MVMLWVLVAALGAVLFAVIVAYNRLVASRNDVLNRWRQIDVQLKRRYDLIPNLVQAVRDVMSFEQETLEKVVAARSRAVGASSPADKMQADSEVTRALASFLAVVERYPEIKSNENVKQLQAELTGTENAIAAARSTYNTAVRDYNNLRQVVPSNVVAGLFGFLAEPYFEAAETDKQVPKVALR
jgi:LemA protein